MGIFLPWTVIRWWPCFINVGRPTAALLLVGLVAKGCRGGTDHANFAHAVRDLGRAVGNEAVLAVERLDAAAAWTRQLYVLYVYAADHGTGAGRTLLEAVLDPAESAALWVADPNPRARSTWAERTVSGEPTAES